MKTAKKKDQASAKALKQEELECCWVNSKDAERPRSTFWGPEHTLSMRPVGGTCLKEEEGCKCSL